MAKKRFLGLLIFLVGIFTIFTDCKQPVSPSKPAKEQPSYTVTFNSNGGSAISSVTVESGKTITRPADPVKTNYDFVGWFRDNNVWQKAWNFASDKVTANVTLYAKWEPAAGTTSYTVKFVTNCSATLADKNVVENDTLGRPDITNPGNALIGWFTTETFESGTKWNFDTDKVTANVTLYAKWEVVEEGKIVVSFYSNGGGSVADQVVGKGAKLEEPSVSKPGYNFAGWYTTEGFNEGTRWKFDTDTVGGGDFILWAKWEAVREPVREIIADAWLIFNGPAIGDVNANGLSVSPNGDSSSTAPVMVQKNGQWALQVKDYNYYIVNKTEVKNASTVTLEITYYDDVAGTFKIQYSSTSVGDGTNIRYRPVSIQKEGTGEYVTVSVTLENCVFDGSQNQNNGAQFRFEGGVIIKSVQLMLADAWLVFDGPTIEDVRANGLGVSPFGDNNINPVMEEIGGKWAQNATGYNYWYVEKDRVKNASTVTMEITYYDNAQGSFNIQYSSVGNTYRPVSVQKSGTGEYVTASVTLENCVFNGTQNQNRSAQFRFAGGVIIKIVKLTVTSTGGGATYTVKFNSNGGGAVTSATGLASGAAVPKPADPSKYGYIFDGWFRDDGVWQSQWNFTTDKVTANITLYAKWNSDNTLVGAYLTFIGPAITNVDANGLRVSSSGESGTTPAMVQNGGQWALSSNGYNYWFVDSAAVKSAATVTLEITYYDDAAGTFVLQYSSSGNAFRPVTLQKGGTKEYVTTWLTLENCIFNGTQNQNQSAQFRFTNGAIIKGIRLTVGGLPDPSALPRPAFSPQTTANNIIGKGVVGYQAWFQAGTNWAHWYGGNPGPGQINVEMWPDTDDYVRNGAALHATRFSNLGDGRTARLFNSRDRTVIFTHFEWMRDYGIDSAAVQRFANDWTKGMTTVTTHLDIIREAAEQYGRSFYVMYDLSGTGSNANLVQDLQHDFIYNAEQKGLVSSSSYAHADNKPVVCLWGIAPQSGRPDADNALALVNWFKGRGYYVIGGIPDNNWVNDTTSYANVYKALNMIFPWVVGRYRSTNVTSWLNSHVPAEAAFCSQYGIAYQAGIFPGFAWTNLVNNNGEPNEISRNAGQFIWQQAYWLLNNHKNSIANLYFCMFDEYDEATAFMKAGRDYFDIPTDQYFLTHAADGSWLSSDFYLRTAGTVIEMLKGSKGLVATIDVPHSLGPLYWRNSFEKRDGRRKTGNATPSPVPDLPIDPGLYNNALLTNKGSGVTLTTNAIPAGADNAGKSGRFVFHLAGNGNGSAYYKIADVKINANAALQLKYSLKPLNTAGRSVFVDILFADGTLLSESNNSVITQRGTVNAWSDVTITIPAKAITGVVVGYSGNGSFSAYVDDIIIQKP